MRIRKTFILRLLIDSDRPDQMQGALTQVGDDPQFFHTDTELVALLKSKAAGVLGLGRDVYRETTTRLLDGSNSNESKVP